MDRYSPGVGSLLAKLERDKSGVIERVIRGNSSTPRPLRWTPTIRKVSDPREDIEDIVGQMDDEAVNAPSPAGWLHRRRERQGVPDGVVELEGRPCCLRTALAVEKRLHLIRGPYTFTCDNCGTTYEIVGEMR